MSRCRVLNSLRPIDMMIAVCKAPAAQASLLIAPLLLCSPSQSCETHWEPMREVVEFCWTGRNMRSLLPTGTNEPPSCLVANLVASDLQRNL